MRKINTTYLNLICIFVENLDRTGTDFPVII